MLNVLIADDHPIVRAGLKQILIGSGEITNVYETGDGLEVLQLIQKNDYGVVVLDISMPGLNGLEALTQIRLLKPHLPVLILSRHPEEQYAVRALKGGAMGYLQKNLAAEELVKAIQTVASGKRYITPTLAEKIFIDPLFANETPLHKRLSDREYSVFLMLAKGQPVSQIAQKILLSVNTVSTYRQRILQKMNMKSNTELTRYAIENKLID